MKRFLVYGLSNEWGGVEAIVMAMVKHLAGEYRFDIIHSNESSSYRDKYQSEVIRFVQMPAWGSNRMGFSDALKVLFHENDYNYVWVNACLMANRTIISTAKKYSKAKIITHSHGSFFEESNLIKRLVLLTLHKLNRSFYKKNVDFPCMCSYKSGLWYYGEKYMNCHHVHYIKNGIDANKFRFDDSIRKSYRMKMGLSDEFAIFHAGRLTEVKNQGRILSIFVDLLATGIKARLFIAGDGELRKDLESQAKELNISDKVHFLGSRNDVNKLYQAMDVMLLPSFHEGFPVTLTEAQASGLPCLVSDRVSDETNITGLVKFISIDDEGNNEWVAAIENLFSIKQTERSKFFNILCKEGFDINSVCDDFLHYIKAQ